MSTGLMFNAFSPIIRDWYDFAITISGPPDLDYPMPAVSSSLVVFIGTMADAVRNAVEEYGADRLRPGDVLICNDPYRVGTHVNDLCFIRPVFHDGQIVAFLNVRAHQLDMGGVVPGGFSGTKVNVYENGLVLGPMLLYSNDRPVRSTFSLIFDNTRLAPLLKPDIFTIFRELQLGERLLTETIDRYGIAAYRGTVRYCCDSSAEAMRDALEKFPDGVYDAEDAIDCDGAGDDEEYIVRARIVKRGAHIEVDLSGTSRQARTCINAGPLDAKTAVVVAFKLMLDPATPFTSGAFRDIDLVVPPGTVLSAMPPDGAIMLYWEVSMVLMMVIFRVIGKAIGKDAVGGDYGSISGHNAHGKWPDGRPWSNIAVCGGEHGPWGADQAHDGDSYTVAYMINNIDPPTEAIEQDSPVLVMRKEYVCDSGGVGYNRGGASVTKDTLWLTAAEHYSMPLRQKRASGTGAYGGSDGQLGAAWLFDPEDPALN
ncbi:MAG: hydantoinase B/oxoprolinase family protein, partial [Gammaproteobacteria bacterium]